MVEGVKATTSFGRQVALLGGMAAVGSALVGCQAPSFDAALRFAKYDLDGSLAASSGMTSGSTDWDRLGLEDEPSVVSPRIDLHMGALDLTVDFAAADFSGNGTTDAQIDLDGVTIPTGTSVASELDIAILRATSTWDLVPGDMTTVGIGLGVAAVDFHARIENTVTNDVADADEIVPLPYAALRLGLDFGAVEIEGLGSFLAVDIGDVNASYIDLDAFLRWRVLGGEDRVSMALVFGFRYADFEAEFDDASDRVEVDARLSGPYVGGSITF